MKARSAGVLSSPVVRAAAVAAVVLVVATRPSSATNSIRNAFTARYPTSTLLTQAQSATGSSCYACHQPTNTSNPGNCYKESLALRIAAGRTAAQAIQDVELLDSDGDGVANREEILTPRTDLAGQIGYNPGLVGATGTDPCATNPNTVVTNRPETPPPPFCPADFNHDSGVDGDDVIAFFGAWDAGDISADFNGDGGVDGD
ncbi:MAG: hypothetical protein ACOYN0_06580, partial [Phycisphaerales bacterium]